MQFFHVCFYLMGTPPYPVYPWFEVGRLVCECFGWLWRCGCQVDAVSIVVLVVVSTFVVVWSVGGFWYALLLIGRCLCGSIVLGVFTSGGVQNHPKHLSLCSSQTVSIRL